MKNTIDSNGLNVVKHIDSHVYDIRSEYDENNNIVHIKESDGFEYWREYDDIGMNMIYHKELISAY